MATNEPIYAVAPINVGGTKFKTGDPIKCGQGARRSLLRLGQAMTEKPGASAPQQRQIPPPEVPEGHTSIDVLGLKPNAVKALAANQIVSVEQLEQRLADGQDLSELPGIGKPTEKDVVAALEEYEPPAE